MRVPVAVFVMMIASCGEHAAPKDTTPSPQLPVVAVAGDAAPPADAAIAIDAAPPPAPAKPGYDFIADIRVLFRVVACGAPETPLPELLTHGDADRTAKLQTVIDHHCKELKPFQDKYRDAYFGKARAWFVAHQPADLPTTAVYAFGGGDLTSALVAFPNATEITTLSLELAGDPRQIDALSPDELDRALAAFRRDIGMLIWVGSNLSTNLSDQQRNAVAAQLSSHLIGLSTGGYEPVSARFFTLDDGGAIHYLEKAEIDADQKTGKSLSGSWKSPSFAQSFGNVEVEYRAIGETAIRVHRHIGWNLGDDYLKKHPGALHHLEQKGKVAICVKGASYMLWLDDFAVFRKYLIEHLAWMISDSTGLAPNFVPASLQQDAYGTFTGPVLPKLAGLRGDLASQKLWSKPKDKMPFRFGYLDKDNHSHVVITYPKP